MTAMPPTCGCHTHLTAKSALNPDPLSTELNENQKLVGHSLKVETSLQTIIGFPIENVQ